MTPGIIPHHRHYVAVHPVEMFPGVVRRTLVSGANATLVEIRLDAGATVPEHTHAHEQAGYVAAGQVVLRFSDGVERVLAQGASYLIPGDEPHFVRALEPSTLVEVFAPVREEFVDYDVESVEVPPPGLPSPEAVAEELRTDLPGSPRESEGGGFP